jgi:cell shape-determining protein MreC
MVNFLSTLLVIEAIIFLYIFIEILRLKKKKSVDILKSIFSLNSFKIEKNKWRIKVLKQREDITDLKEETEALHKELELKMHYLEKLRKSFK